MSSSTSTLGAPAYGHAACGLRLLATGPVPGLARADGDGPWDVVVHLGSLPPTADSPGERLHVSADRDEQGRPLLVVRALAGDGFLMRYADGTEFVVDPTGERVWARWPSPWTLDDAATYLVGPVLAFVLRRRGITALHASAVALGERAVALVGPAGAGKSTLAAAFARNGYPVLADDVVALARRHGAFVVEPGSPRIRLWPEAVEALYGAPEALPRLTPTWDKRFLDVEQAWGRRSLGARPLAAVYVLADGAGGPRVEPVTPAAALIALVANTSVNYLLDAGLRAAEFRTLGELVASVPVRRLVSRHDPTLLGRLCDLVLEDARADA
jgi:hypothetical protein